MNFIKRSPWMTSTIKTYQTASLILQTEDKAVPKTKNPQSPASSSIFKVLTSIGLPKHNRTLMPIPQTERPEPSICPKKKVQWLWPILKNLGFQVSDAPTPIYNNIQPRTDNIKKNHLTIRDNHIVATILYVHDKYDLLNIYPVKLRTIIQPEDIGNKRSTGPLIYCHYSYIPGTRYYHTPNSDHYHRFSYDALRKAYHPTDPSKDIWLLHNILTPIIKTLLYVVLQI